MAEVINPAEYYLGPGDKLYVTLLGTIIKSQSVTVTPTNDIILEDSPPVAISKLKLSEVGAFLETSLKNVFKNTTFKVSLLQPRKIKIGVVLLGRPMYYVTVYSGTRISEVISKFVLEGKDISVIEPKNAGTQYGNSISQITSLLQNEGSTSSSTSSNVSVDLDKISLRRIKVKRGDIEFYADVEKYYKIQDKNANPYALEGDILILSKRSNFVVISGHVKYPGAYEYVEGDSLGLLINMAGGFLETAKKNSIKIIRNPDPRVDDNKVINIVDSLEIDKTKLEKNDVINVYGKEIAKELTVVTVKGEIQKPGVYGIKKGVTRLKTILDEAGGITKLAYLPASSVVRKEKIDMYPILSDPLSGIRYDDNPELQYIIAQKRMRRGIVSVDLLRLMNGDETQNLLLEAGDEINIAQTVSYITVLGRVVTPGKIEFVEGRSVLEYVENAGGFANRARSHDILVQKPNSGELIPWDKVVLERGDVILVQEKTTPFIDDFIKVSTVITTITTVIITENPTGSGAGGINSALGGLGIENLLGGSSKSNEVEKITKLIKSRRVADSVVKDLRLDKVFKNKTSEQNANQLLGMIKVSEKKSDFINVTISVGSKGNLFSKVHEDSAKVLGLEISRSIVRNTDKILREFLYKKSLANANFYKIKMEEARLEKDTAQFKLAKFEKDNKAIEMTEQAKAQIEMMASMQAQMFTEKLNLDILEQERLSSDPLVTEARNKIKLYEKQYNDVLYGKSGGYVIGVDKFSDLKVQYGNLFLESRLRGEIYLFLKQMYLKEVLQGSKNTPTIEVLQPSVIPDYASNKSKVIHVAIGVTVGLLIGLTICGLIKLYEEMLAEPDNEEIVREVKRMLDFGWVKKMVSGLYKHGLSR
ncbi:hypothetical protein CHS0354_023742 [Potamilus streckersoni]|uniref:Soluble ligand binding domain-containing protein n=1 Tax=Potamilus streckersoni TaxID=2493646 RepID=A0AAE0RZ04_9BIVA|nr:hypothetical protein CHS0354_023742 [Potamilus streckersoni]